MEVTDSHIAEKSILHQVMDGYRSTGPLRFEIADSFLRETELPTSVKSIERPSKFVSTVNVSPKDGKIEIVYGHAAHEAICGKSLFVVPKHTKTDAGYPSVGFECVPGPDLPSNVICRDCTRPRPVRAEAELPIPPILLSRIQQGRWPRSLSNRMLRQLSSYITDEEFELFITVDEMRGENDIASLELLYDFAEDERRAKRWKLALGSEIGGKVDRDWLDLERALVIGGGANYGDDKWLVLDYRMNQQDPRVIFNWYQHQDGIMRDERDPENYQIAWRELSPSITELAAAISKP